jgi:hypothetical protein
MYMDGKLHAFLALRPDDGEKNNLKKKTPCL